MSGNSDPPIFVNCTNMKLYILWIVDNYRDNMAESFDRRRDLPPLPPGVEMMHPPPSASPVSSSYSELRRTIVPPSSYNNYNDYNYSVSQADYQPYLYPSSSSQVCTLFIFFTSDNSCVSCFTHYAGEILHCGINLWTNRPPHRFENDSQLDDIQEFVGP